MEKLDKLYELTSKKTLTDEQREKRINLFNNVKLSAKIAFVLSLVLMLVGYGHIALLLISIGVIMTMSIMVKLHTTADMVKRYKEKNKEEEDIFIKKMFEGDDFYDR